MIIDKLRMFFENEALAATKASQSLDVGKNVGEGQPLFIHALVTEAFAGGTSITLALQDSDNDSAFTNVLVSHAVPLAELKAGYEFKFGSVPRTLKRYLRLNATVSGTMSGGKLTAFINLDN